VFTTPLIRDLRTVTQGFSGEVVPLLAAIVRSPVITFESMTVPHLSMVSGPV
jgi:hypothetical protein